MVDHIQNLPIATINPINKKYNKCFQYAATVAVNYEGKKKKNEKNNALLKCMHAKKEKIYPAYVSKYKSNCEKQVILLMISKG